MNTPACSTPTQDTHEEVYIADSRVPVNTLFEYLEEGETIDSFLIAHPHLTRKQVISVLEASRKQLVEA